MKRTYSFPICSMLLFALACDHKPVPKVDAGLPDAGAVKQQLDVDIDDAGVNDTSLMCMPLPNKCE